MWTISINSAINTGENAHYDESCSSTLASTFSNGAKDPNTGVATTDLYGKCTRTHSGTSAAAPEAAGVTPDNIQLMSCRTWRTPRPSQRPGFQRLQIRALRPDKDAKLQ